MPIVVSKGGSEVQAVTPHSKYASRAQGDNTEMHRSNNAGRRQPPPGSPSCMQAVRCTMWAASRTQERHEHAASTPATWTLCSDSRQPGEAASCPPTSNPFIHVSDSGVEVPQSQLCLNRCQVPCTTQKRSSDACSTCCAAAKCWAAKWNVRLGTVNQGALRTLPTNPNPPRLPVLSHSFALLLWLGWTCLPW